jgi:hypothetical protein
MWADRAIKELQSNKNVIINPRGHSMSPLVKDNATVELSPSSEYNVEDVVLVKVSGRVYLHKISAVKGSDKKMQYQISNNKGHVNGWVSKNSIFGKAIKISN